ncbi:roadblock/LC7 domain-containing protein [Micromonospora sp. NPDC093277]|uniref:roadblock/LC7 domain-containing protein n=1 Tax=Micromonospora sp. NPDC093277 TaxID=3364291 RepID=UPI00382795DC
MTHGYSVNGNGNGQGLPDCAWLIDQFAEDVPGVTHAVLVSLDGLQLAASRGVGRDVGDQLSALAAGMLSMADRGGALLDLGASEYLTVRLPRGHMLFMRVGESAGLAVAAAPGCDLRVVSYRMTQFVSAVWHILTPQVRHDLHRLTVGQPHRPDEGS